MDIVRFGYMEKNEHYVEGQEAKCFLYQCIHVSGKDVKSRSIPISKNYGVTEGSVTTLPGLLESRYISRCGIEFLPSLVFFILVSMKSNSLATASWDEGLEDQLMHGVPLVMDLPTDTMFLHGIQDWLFIKVKKDLT